MKYILMIHVPRGTGAFQSAEWSPQDIAAHMSYLRRLNNSLVASGELVGIEALAPPGNTKLVRAGKGGLPAVTDGPFPESKEFLAGYWIVDVDGPERAYDIAATASSAPGPGGAPLLMSIEVRQVIGAPPVDR